MKPLCLAIALMTSAGLAQAACTGDLPQNGVLHVYADATSDGVVGGIGANQCGLEVTDFCENGRCLTFYKGLSGYIEVSSLASGTIAPAPLVFEYRVNAVAGSLDAMGRTQLFTLSPDDPIRITPAEDHVVLSLPDPLAKDLRLTSTGSSGWEGVLPDWAGVPVPVTVYLDRLGAAKASLELFAEHKMLTMDMRLALTRLEDGPQSTADAAARITPAPGSADATDTTCHDLMADLRPVLRGADSSDKRAVLATMVSLGITSIDPANPSHCSEISAALARQ